MIVTLRIFRIIFIALAVISCNNKKTEPISKEVISTKSNAEEKDDSIAGLYKGEANDCNLTVEIIKTESGYSYILRTKVKNLKGIATFSTGESGEKLLVLKGIEWDEYEGDISREDATDSISEPEIPIGIGASYVKDTLTIQNYGNAMNSYTKIAECGSKFIQLIKQ